VAAAPWTAFWARAGASVVASKLRALKYLAKALHAVESLKGFDYCINTFMVRIDFFAIIDGYSFSLTQEPFRVRIDTIFRRYAQ
jgi:hypothetical protein